MNADIECLATSCNRNPWLLYLFIDPLEKLFNHPHQVIGILFATKPPDNLRQFTDKSHIKQSI